MTIEEKMEHFRQISLEHAGEKSMQSISEYKKSQDEELKLYKESAKATAEQTQTTRINQAASLLKKDFGAQSQLQKKEITSRQLELTDELFEEVKDKLLSFKATPSYPDYLVKITEIILKDYDKYDLTLTLSSTDADRKDFLESKFNRDFVVSKDDFFGGIRCIIPEKNILIDYSFKTMLQDKKDSYIMTYKEAEIG